MPPQGMLNPVAVLHPGQALLGQDGFIPNLAPPGTAVHIAGPLAIDAEKSSPTAFPPLHEKKSHPRSPAGSRPAWCNLPAYPATQSQPRDKCLCVSKRSPEYQRAGRSPCQESPTRAICLASWENYAATETSRRQPAWIREKEAMLRLMGLGYQHMMGPRD